ncbi:MAG: hypothetical protein D0528_01450 [Methylococcales bacterium]|nr:MAG: hypothetical protein D0528_01450 [Methylococcales bacterium]
MQKEYDLTQLKVKRRGLLTDLPPSDDSPSQVAVSLLLDNVICDYNRYVQFPKVVRVYEGLYS